MSDPIMDGLTSNPSRGRLRHAYLMARASFAYTYGYPMPDELGGRIGFWYALRGAVSLFIEYATKRRVR